MVFSLWLYPHNSASYWLKEIHPHPPMLQLVSGREYTGWQESRAAWPPELSALQNIRQWLVYKALTSIPTWVEHKQDHSHDKSLVFSQPLNPETIVWECRSEVWDTLKWGSWRILASSATAASFSGRLLRESRISVTSWTLSSRTAFNFTSSRRSWAYTHTHTNTLKKLPLYQAVCGKLGTPHSKET